MKHGNARIQFRVSSVVNSRLSLNPNAGAFGYRLESPMAANTWKTATNPYAHTRDRRVTWPHVANTIVGMGLAAAAVSIEDHPQNLLWSDLASSAAIIILSSMAYTGRFPWAAWLTAGVGLWLMGAPLVLWAPSTAAYNLDTLAGCLVFTFAAIVPSLVNERADHGPVAPTGWSYNPSAWPQRAGIIAFAFAQFFVARVMAMYQLGHTEEIWDPVFGAGTRNVLESEVSKAFPVSDAGLGAMTYLIEAFTGFLGGTRRWRTMPWAVVLFGVMIVPVGVVSIVLVVLQPVAVGAWCFWCLITAALTVVMIGPAIDEVVATGIFLLRAHREGQSFWQAFWQGGAIEAGPHDEVPRKDESLVRRLAGGLEILSIPWNLAVCAVLGIWMMASPIVLETTGWAANNAHLIGALVVTFAAIGFSEAGRAGRFMNLVLGAWLVAAPFVLAGANQISTWHDAVIGLAVMALSLRRGRINERFGAWDRWII
jgi:uncharacterized membrane protein